MKIVLIYTRKTILKFKFQSNPQKTNFCKLLLQVNFTDSCKKKYLYRFKFLKTFHLKDQFWLIIIALTHLSATEMSLSKFSVVSVFPKWLYSPERKPGNAGNFYLWKLWVFFLKLLKTNWKWHKEFKFQWNWK